MRDARELLVDARRLFDARENGLAAAAARVRWDFGSGAAWMRAALTAVRGVQPSGAAAFGCLGFAKYGLATSVAAAVAMFAGAASLLLVPLAVVAFYLVEVRMVFAFPLALDGSAAPLRDSHALVARTLPAWVATARVMRIAAEMMAGGFLGRGFVRSWCVGCLAVVLWYEDARRAVAAPA